MSKRAIEETGRGGWVLVTGATGNVGREVARALRRADIPVRAGVRSLPAQGASDDCDRVRVDFHDRSSWQSSLRGCAGLFLLRPPAISNVEATLLPFIDVARGCGVRHVVFLSVAGADRNRLVPHYKVERHLEQVDADWTILRPGFFAQNLADAYAREIRARDRLYVPAGAGRVAFVDLRDVATVAALAFGEPQRHVGRGYVLTGPEAFSFEEVAAELSAGLGRSIEYKAASVPGYLWHLRQSGLRWSHALVQTVLHVGLRFGQAERIDPTMEQLLGHRPRSIRDYVRDHAHLWRP